MTVTHEPRGADAAQVAVPLPGVIPGRGDRRRYPLGSRCGHCSTPGRRPTATGTG